MSIAYTDFRSALRMRESSGNYQVVNPYGYLGADLVVVADDATRLTLKDTDLADLSASDFIFG